MSSSVTSTKSVPITHSGLVYQPEPRLKQWRYLYFGYLVDDEWLVKYALRNKLVPDLAKLREKKIKEVPAVIFEATLNIIGRAGIIGLSKIGTVLDLDEDPVRCLVLGTNDPLDELPQPGPETWAKLKEILETPDDPQWYLAMI